ncbi:MAG: hypothetical protein ACK4NE_00845 [Albidovulum sp.]
MPIIVTLALIVLAAFVSTRTGSADAFIAVLVVAPLAALGRFYVLLLVGWIIQAIRSGSKPR